MVGILKSQPQKVFEIAEVVNLIFVEAIPQTARKGAKDRVSNILAEGSRNGEWHRPLPAATDSPNSRVKQLPLQSILLFIVLQ